MKIWGLIALAFGLFGTVHASDNLYELLEVTENATS